MGLDAFFDGLEKLMDELRERWPRATFWVIVALWSLAAAIPTAGAALTGAGWFSILIPLAPLIVIGLTYWGGVEWIPTWLWVTALSVWALLPGGLASAGPKDGAAKTATAAFLFCYGQLLVALLTAICVRRGFSVRTPFAQLRLTRLRLVAAAFPLALSFRPDPSRPGKGASWHELAWLLVFATVMAACALPGARKALLAALAIAGGAWAILAHAAPGDRWAQIGENGWLWATGCYQWLRTSRQDFWHGGHERVTWQRAA
ncbi:uncharacterized membrane protein YhaH (DUF805 family) [Catenulispora sp. GP43]|uniref:hypothetical protein n=1 Tax=Catenulispora sp. GP43 TaxID=3156263 RepID=UPI003518C570